jgi:hypothetical protein
MEVGGHSSGGEVRTSSRWRWVPWRWGPMEVGPMEVGSHGGGVPWTWGPMEVGSHGHTSST